MGLGRGAALRGLSILSDRCQSHGGHWEHGGPPRSGETQFALSSDLMGTPIWLPGGSGQGGGGEGAASRGGWRGEGLVFDEGLTWLGWQAHQAPGGGGAWEEAGWAWTVLALGPQLLSPPALPEPAPAPRAVSTPPTTPRSVSGDDRSLSSSSSEASHSDVSAGSRLTAWPEPSSSSASTSQEGPGLVAAQASGEAVPGTSRPPPKPLRPRQLREVGRQSSSDSGIATGSHSSYSGSFSSCAGSSLDVWRAGDEFGSLLSLPPAAGVPEPSLCACPPGTAEYQVPTALRHHYDTPRSLRQAPRDQTPAAQGGPSDSGAGDSGGQMSAGCPSGWLGARRQGQATEALGCEAPGEGWEAGSPHAGPPPAFFSSCPVCGGLKVNPPP